MATMTCVPNLTVNQYLQTVYRPDVDYVDGAIEERNLGEFDHGTLQANLYNLFHMNRKAWRIRVALDTRMQITKTRYRVPDVSILSLDTPKEQIIRQVPLLCIEVLSPKDTLGRILKRAEDHVAIGVPALWVFDPQTRTAYTRVNGVDSSQQGGSLALAGTPIHINVDEVFAALDEE